MICRVNASQEGVEEGLEPRSTVKQALQMTVTDAGALVVRTEGNVKGIAYAPGTWVYAQLEAEAP